MLVDKIIFEYEKSETAVGKYRLGFLIDYYNLKHENR
jgi:hypothetical protein